MFGPHFLACLAFNKFGLHQPLNSQRDRLESQGIPLSLSTLADQIGAIAAAVKPVFLLLEAHTLGAGRLHGDDTTVPRLAKYKTDIARMWTYVCDDAPFAGGRAPAALFYYSRDRKGEHSRGHLTGYRGILQADNYAGYNALYDPGRAEGTITHAACWAHARRYFFELADIATQLKRKPGKRVVISPLAIEAVQRIDRIFAIERDINGSPAAERHAGRQILSAPLVAELGDWMAGQSDAIKAPFLAARADVGRIFYFGESVLLPQFRGMGIGNRFFDEREAAARAAGATHATFCAVARESDHPLRPADVRDLTPFWTKRGYRLAPRFEASLSWTEVGGTEETPHLMRFWAKNL